MNALVIGCGNIGAGYDLNNAHILTHAKAFHLKKGIKLFVYDEQIERSEKIAKKYKATLVKNLDDKVIKQMDLLSICVSTDHHYSYLEKLIRLQAPIVICEKPLTNDLKELKKLKAFKTGKTLVFVNYIRRFQPSYLVLKKRIHTFLKEEQLDRIDIRYQRGFINNCSHAFDLLEFLFESPLNFKRLKVTACTFDTFKNDPTLSANFIDYNCKVSATGLTKNVDTVFEIDIYTNKRKIEISESGDLISYFKIDQKTKKHTENKKLKQTNAIKDYMKNVIEQILKLSKTKGSANLNSSIALNEKLLKIVSNLKN